MCEYMIPKDFKMNKHIYDENNGLQNELQDDCSIPCLTLPAKPIGLWGQRHKRYLQKQTAPLYQQAAN